MKIISEIKKSKKLIIKWKMINITKSKLRPKGFIFLLNLSASFSFSYLPF
jgi:hypothetical protein